MGITEKKDSGIISYKNAPILAFLLIAIGIIIRAVQFGEIPCGFNQDEAFAGYEAFSLLNYGVDSAGYHNPCYFVSWGSGMNVLESYLAIPFMKLFGCSVLSFRLPQLLLSVISLPVFYLLIQKIYSYKAALIGLGLLAVSPWHILLSRWGLESNLAPAFLLIGLYFFILGISKNRYLIFAAIAYGMSLYAYSITWLAVPLTIVLCSVYLICTKQKISCKYIIISGIILFVFALPLILFLLVNKGIIPEIRTGFISIPKLLAMRDSEVSIKNLILPESYNNLFNVFLNQNDGLIWNSTEQFGMFYKISIPFIVIGAAKIISKTVKSVPKKEFAYETFILIGMLSSVFTCLLISNLNVNKANSLHFFTLILLTVGIKETLIIFRNHLIIPKAILLCFSLFFIYFSSFYLSSYNQQISYNFRDGVEDAVEYVKEQDYDDICVDSSIYYSQILFFDRTPNDVFRNTVEYTNYPSAFLRVSEFGNYEFGIDYNNLENGKAYIAKSNEKSTFITQGYNVEEFENYIVAFKNNNISGRYGQ